jgi:hypothetical protein
MLTNIIKFFNGAIWPFWTFESEAVPFLLCITIADDYSVSLLLELVVLAYVFSWDLEKYKVIYLFLSP